MTLIFRPSVSTALACLAMLFCFGANASHVFAQKSETLLSKRPPVVKIFDPTKTSLRSKHADRAAELLKRQKVLKKRSFLRVDEGNHVTQWNVAGNDSDHLSWW